MMCIGAGAPVSHAMIHSDRDAEISLDIIHRPAVATQAAMISWNYASTMRSATSRGLVQRLQRKVTRRMRSRSLLGGYFTGSSPDTFCQRLVLGEVSLALRVEMLPPRRCPLRVRPISQASDTDHLHVGEVPQDWYELWTV